MTSPPHRPPRACPLELQVHPWWDAQYLIPMLGMLLGNACSGIAVGLSTVLEELSAGGPGRAAGGGRRAALLRQLAWLRPGR